MMNRKGLITSIMKKDSQCEKILAYINENGSITPLDALREFGCMRLASRVNDLKRAGYAIISEMETKINKHGDIVRYSRYRMEN